MNAEKWIVLWPSLLATKGWKVKQPHEIFRAGKTALHAKRGKMVICQCLGHIKIQQQVFFTTRNRWLDRFGWFNL